MTNSFIECTLRQALKGCVQELENVLAAINKNQMPYDGDEFHERLQAARDALNRQSAQQKHDRIDAERQAIIKAQDEAIAALLDFASTVAGGSSWWDEVWPEHEAALDVARKGGSNG